MDTDFENKNTRIVSVPAWLSEGLADGVVFKGRITGFTGYGAFVEVNGIGGVLKDGDYSDDHSSVSEQYKLNDRIKVRCKKVQPGKDKLHAWWELPVKVHRTQPVRCALTAGVTVRAQIVAVCNLPAGKAVFARTTDGGDPIDILCPALDKAGREVTEGETRQILISSVYRNVAWNEAPRVRGFVLKQREIGSKKYPVVSRYQIWWASLPWTETCVQRGTRPVVIVSNDIANRASPVVTVVPLTSKEKEKLPTHVRLETNLRPGVISTALCEQMISLDKSRLIACVGKIEDAVTLMALDRAMRTQLGISA